MSQPGSDKNTLRAVVILFEAMGFLASALILKKLLYGMYNEVF
jgi:hypothetical protein